jgi:branched-subunit amino acid transport protein
MSTFFSNPMTTSPAQLWLTMFIAGLITYGMRLSFIYLFGRYEIPELLRRMLRFVPPAVLTAIIFPEILINAGKVDVSLGNARLLAGLVAIVVAWRTKSALLTIVVGMAVLWLLQWLQLGL